MGILLKGALFFDAACNMPVRILLLMMGFALYGLNAAQFDRKIYHFEYPDFLQPDESPDWAISQSQQGRTVALVQKGSNPAIGIVVTADADFVNSREHIDRVRRQS